MLLRRVLMILRGKRENCFREIKQEFATVVQGIITNNAMSWFHGTACKRHCGSIAAKLSRLDACEHWNVVHWCRDASIQSQFARRRWWQGRWGVCNHCSTWHPSLELFTYGCNVLAQHPFHWLPITVSMHDCWIVSICMCSGNGGWRVRDAGVEEKGHQNRSLWDAVDMLKYINSLITTACFWHCISQEISKQIFFAKMWFIQNNS